MLRTSCARLATIATAAALWFLPRTLSAQQALVYCPVGIDATGCNAIVAALAADATRFSGGAEAGYDGTQGTVDLATADFSAYAVFVVPSLADGPDAQPYALLRNSTIAGRLGAAFVGRVAVWSGTPDVGSTNRSVKDQLIRNLAAWARPDAAGTHGPGIVALQDNSDNGVGRYNWLGGISALSVTADTTLEVYSNVQVLTATGQTILTNSSGLQIGYTNMASAGLVAGSGGTNGATGGRTTRVVLVTAAGSEAPAGGIATIDTDKDDYAPGETIQITGTGWQPGETVSLRLHEDPVVNGDRTASAVADDQGNIVNSSFILQPNDVGVRFVLTATGQSSGLMAQTTFTDAVGLQTVSVGAPTPASVAPGASATYLITVGFSGNNSTCNVNLSITTSLPTGATGSFSPNPVISANNLNKTSTLTITTTSSTPAGTTSFTVQGAEGTGCSGSNTLRTATGSLVVTKIATTTAVARSAGSSPSVYGTAVDFTATVSYSPTALVPSATSTVTFKDGATTLGSPVAIGSCNTVARTCTATLSGVDYLTVNGGVAHGITATYNGDGAFATSTSAGLSHTVTKQPLTITAETKARVFGASNPPLTVVYNGFVLGETESVLGGTLSCTTTAIATSPVGTYAITCGGQTAANYSLSYSPGQLTITAAATATSAGNATANFGDASVTLTAQVTAVSPSTATVGEGSVQFTVRQGVTTIGSPVTASVSGGSASASFVLGSGVNAGTYAIEASYQPIALNPNFQASTDPTPGSLTVAQAPTTTTITRTAGTSPSTYGGSLTFRATVAYTTSAGTPSATSTVTFKDGTTTLGSPVALGATCSAVTKTCTADLTIGSLDVPGSPHSLTAHFDGETNFAASTSAALGQAINKTTLTVTAENKTRIFGAPNPVFTATYAGFVLAQTESVLGGTLTCTTTATAASTVAGSPYQITCSGLTAGNYAFDYQPGQLSITPAPTTTAGADATATYGDASVTLTAQVTANSPSTATVNEGSVEFTVNSSTVTGSVNGGTATVSFTLGATVNAGSYDIATSYVPAASGANFQASTDLTVATLTVKPAPTTTAVELETGANPSTYGDPLTFLATVSYSAASAAPSSASTVTFKDGMTAIGSPVPLGTTCNTGTKKCTAELNIATLEVPGSPHSITAHYNGDGDGNFAASTSPAVSHTVNKKTLTITAVDKTRVFGAPNPPFTVGYDGFVLGQTESELGGTLTCTTTANGSSTVAGSPYKITCSGQTAANYALNYVQGDLTITPAQTATAADDATATYGDADVTLTAQVTASSPSTATVNEGSVVFTVNSSTVTAAVSGGTASASFPLGAGVNAGEYAIAASYQPKASDPDFLASTDPSPGKLTVKPAPTTTALELKTGANPSTYGDDLTFEATVAYEAPSGTPSSSSTVTFNEGTTALGAPVALGSCVTATKTCKAVFSIASLDVSGSPHSITAHYDGNGNGNFAVSTSGPVHQTVNKKALTITAQNASREYGDANPEFTVVYDGFVLSQNETALGGSLTCSTTASKPSAVADGPYPITCLGQTSANYQLTYKPGSLSLTRAPLTVTANSYSKVYGDGLPVFAGTVVTLKNSDPITALYKAYEGVGGLVLATATTPASPTPYPIVVTLDDPQNKLPNYTKTLVDGKLTINKATPAYASLSAPTIVFGAASTVLSGKLSYAGQGSGGVTVYPSGSVLITVNNTTAQASISGATGDFSVAFPTGALPASGTGHSIKYDYPSDGNFTSAIDNTHLLKVLYNTAVGHQFLQPINPNLTSGNRSSFKIGSVIPAKFQIFRADGTTPVTTAIAKISVFKIDNIPETQVNEDLLAIPADDGIYFRVSGGQYIYNLGTKNWTAGTFRIVATLDDLSTVEAIVDGRSK